MPAPVRTCIACREAAAPEDLVRFVESPSGEVVFDLRGKLPGRGGWVHPTASCLALLEAKPGLFSRALKGHVSVPKPLRAALREVLEHSALELLSLAAAGGNLVVGQERIETALRGGDLAAVVWADDVARRTAAALMEASPESVIHVHLPVERAVLGQQIGRGLAAALGVRPSDATRGLLRQLRRIHQIG